jgi:putative flippase GtrA
VARFSFSRQAQFTLFIAVGGLQFAIDTAALYFLLLAAMPAVPANLLSRAAAASLGFMLNRGITFRAHGAAPRAGTTLRFWLFWAVMTLASTLLMAGAAHWLGTGPSHALSMTYAKMAIEIFLFVISFLASRHWVFRHD